MSDIQRSSDVVEEHSSLAIMLLIGGGILLVLGIVIAIYSNMQAPVAFVLLGIGLTCTGLGIKHLLDAKKVSGVSVECPYCQFRNTLTETPNKDFACRGCNRMIPMEKGVMLKVEQVRCGYCNHLNYYSERSHGLLCEECDSIIPIAGIESDTKRIAAFARKEVDETSYELVLVSVEHRTEELISAMQQMMALNRNHVKDILDTLPQPLLSGINHTKADMLSAQLSIHKAKCEIRPYVPS